MSDRQPCTTEHCHIIISRVTPDLFSVESFAVLPFAVLLGSCHTDLQIQV